MPAPAPAEPVELDVPARVALAHAAVDALARRAGLDLLHVKGPSLHPSLRRPGRISSDADVLVRPTHVDLMLRTLAAHGWRQVTGFATGSPFQHAANWHHDDWGYVDVHRSFPGLGLPADDAFDRLWAERGTTQVAHRSCPVPSLRDQTLLLCLHAARGQGDLRSREDVDHVWRAAPPERRDEVRARAAALDAEVALAAVTGDREPATSPPEQVALWHYFAHGGTRLEEWRARFRAAEGVRGRAQVLLRALDVNRDYEAMVLGREPTRREIWGRQAVRLRTALGQLARRVR